MNTQTTIQLATQIIGLAATAIPEVAAAAGIISGLLQSGGDPTPEQQATIDTDLQNAHKALQAAVAART